MRGILVTNAFLKNDKFAEHYIWLEEAAGRQGMSLSLLENTNLLSVIGGGSALPYDGLPEELAKLAEENDFVIYWDKDISQGKLLEACCDRKTAEDSAAADGDGADDVRQCGVYADCLCR